MLRHAPATPNLDGAVLPQALPAPWETEESRKEHQPPSRLHSSNPTAKGNSS